MTRFLLLVPLMLATSAVAQLASGDYESPEVYRRSTDGLPSGEELEISRRSVEAEGSGSGEAAFRTLECACVIAEKIEVFEAADQPADSPASEQSKDAYRHRRAADETNGWGSGQKKEPVAFVHHAATSRSDSAEAVVTVHRIVVCKCEEAGEGSGAADDDDEEATNPSAAPAAEESEVYRRSAASGEEPAVRNDAAGFLASGEEEAAPVRRSALDTAEASGDDEETIATISTASTPELPTISTVQVHTASLPTIATRARRQAEGSAEESEMMPAEEMASGEEAALPTIPTASTPELTTASLPTLATISTASLPTISTVRVSTVSLPTLAPITRAQRHAEGSGMTEEN